MTHPLGSPYTRASASPRMCERHPSPSSNDKRLKTALYVLLALIGAIVLYLLLAPLFRRKKTTSAPQKKSTVPKASSEREITPKASAQLSRAMNAASGEEEKKDGFLLTADADGNMSHTSNIHVNATRMKMDGVDIIAKEVLASNNSEVGGAIRIVNPRKEGEEGTDNGKVNNWTLWNMTGPTYGDRLSFWRYTKHGTTNSGSAVDFYDNGNVSVVGSITAGGNVRANGNMITNEINATAINIGRWKIQSEGDTLVFRDMLGQDKRYAMHPNRSVDV